MLSLSFSLSHSLSLILSLTLSLSATNTGGCLLTCPKSTLEIKQRACLHASLTRQQSDAARSRTGPGTGHPPPVHATTPPRLWGCLWGGRARTTLTRSGFRRSRSGRCARARPPSKSSHRCTTAHVSINYEKKCSAARLLSPVIPFTAKKIQLLVVTVRHGHR